MPVDWSLKVHHFPNVTVQHFASFELEGVSILFKSKEKHFSSGDVGYAVQCVSIF